MSKIKLAFIGCGGMAGAHLNGYLELKRKGIDIFDIVALVDPVEANTEKFAHRIAEVQEFPIPTIYKDPEKMLAEQKPHAADICTPHFLHHNHAIMCLEAGVHSIVEKPLGVTIKATKKMIQAAEDNNRILAVAEQVRRWLPARTVAWAVHNGMIGDPQMFFAHTVGGSKINPDETIRNRVMTWRQNKLTGGGGPIFDFGVHYIDLLIYIFGDIESVHAYSGKFGDLKYKDTEGNVVEPTVEDTCIASIKFKSGVVGTWNWSGIAPGKSLSYTVYYGSKGSIYSGGVYPNSPQLQLWDDTIKEPSELIHEFVTKVDKADLERFFPQEVYPEPEKVTGDHGVLLEVYDFLKAIIDNRPPELGGWDGLKAQAVPIAFFESAQSGQVVTIDDVMEERVEAYQQEINHKWRI
ncbi:hypothetical protein GF312_20970 [Candidatus Poribacteria bacterium]|nr:hypothetical protein [Candidatus Poribacteria bacterium]